MGQFHSKVKKFMKTLGFSYDNVPGLTSVYAIPLSAVSHPEKYYINNYHELIEDNNTIQIPVYQGDRFTYNEAQSLEDGGNLWATSLNGIIPRLHHFNAENISALERGEWIIVHQDCNGVVLLSGTADVPMKFTADKSSGTASELNGYHFRFSAKNAVPSLILESPEN